MTTRRDRPVTHMRRDEALVYLDGLARGLAEMLGPSCETLVQEVSETNCCTVRAIYNGHVSGRQVGSTLSIYGGDTAQDGDKRFDFSRNMISLEAVTASGRRVKSSSWFLRGHGYMLLLGVNLDVTALSQAAEIIGSLASVGSDLRESLSLSPSLEGTGTPEALIEECLHLVGKPAEALTRDDRIELERLLNERGFFEFQKGVVTLAARLGVSRSTIYGDLAAGR